MPGRSSVSTSILVRWLQSLATISTKLRQLLLMSRYLEARHEYNHLHSKFRISEDKQTKSAFLVGTKKHGEDLAERLCLAYSIT